MQRIRPAVEVLSSGIGVDHALASRRLYTDGAEVLYDYATEHDEEELGGLTVVRTGQRDSLRSSVTTSSASPTGPMAGPPGAPADLPARGCRRRSTPGVWDAAGRSRWRAVEDLVDRFVAGDTLADIAEDFGVPEPEVEDVVRVATRAAA